MVYQRTYAYRPYYVYEMKGVVLWGERGRHTRYAGGISYFELRLDDAALDSRYDVVLCSLTLAFCFISIPEPLCQTGIGSFLKYSAEQVIDTLDQRVQQGTHIGIACAARCQ
jgi:hypothetical protein